MISALIVLTIGQLVLNLGLDGPASIYTANVRTHFLSD